eukprot:1674035-Rhodomonas_salina.2
MNMCFERVIQQLPTRMGRKYAEKAQGRAMERRETWGEEGGGGHEELSEEDRSPDRKRPACRREEPPAKLHAGQYRASCAARGEV